MEILRLLECLNTVQGTFDGAHFPLDPCGEMPESTHGKAPLQNQGEEGKGQDAIIRNKAGKGSKANLRQSCESAKDGHRTQYLANNHRNADSRVNE